MPITPKTGSLFHAETQLINQKRAGKPITPKSKPAATNVVNLMEALRRSASSGQKEMLMPIEGKKPKEAAAKKPAARPQRKSA